MNDPLSGKAVIQNLSGIIVIFFIILQFTNKIVNLKKSE